MEARPERAAAPKPKRRWFQFSLATLLVLTAVCAVVLALWVAPAERQRRAVAFLEEHGGSVWYADAKDEAAFVPECLRRWMGKDYFQDVWFVDLSGTRINGAGFAHLQAFEALEWLFLCDTRVGDAELTYLGRLTALKELDLRGTQVSDTGLTHLEGLTALESLYLIDTRVSDAGFVHLKRMSALKRLWVSSPHVRDAGLAHLQGLTALTRLYLVRTQVGDAGLAHLQRLPALERLNLAHTQVSDAGLSHLEGLRTLEELYLYDTRVNDAGVADLQKALPNSFIAWRREVR